MQKEVESYANKILEICKIDKEIDELFKGVNIYFAPAIEEVVDILQDYMKIAGMAN